MIVTLTPPPVRRSPAWRRVAIAAALAAITPWLLIKLEQSRHARPLASRGGDETFDVDVSVAPGLASLELDGRPVAVGHYSAKLPKDGSLHQLRISADGYVTQEIGFRNGPPPSRVNLVAAPAGLDDSAREPLPFVETHIPYVPGRRPKASARTVGQARRRATESASSSGAGAKPSLASTSTASASAERSASADDFASSLAEASAGNAGGQPRIRVIDEPMPQVQVIE